MLILSPDHHHHLSLNWFYYDAKSWDVRKETFFSSIISAGIKVLDRKRIVMNLSSHHHSRETKHIRRFSQARDKSLRIEGRHRCHPRTPS